MIIVKSIKQPPPRIKAVLLYREGKNTQIVSQEKVQLLNKPSGKRLPEMTESSLKLK